MDCLAEQHSVSLSDASDSNDQAMAGKGVKAADSRAMACSNKAFMLNSSLEDEARPPMGCLRSCIRASVAGKSIVVVDMLLLLFA